MAEATIKHSRLGKRPVDVPQGVTVQLADASVTVKGPKGETSRPLRPEVKVEQRDGRLHVTPLEGAGRRATQFQGLIRALLANMVEGATKGFACSLDFRGVGYRAAMEGPALRMTVGLSHQPLIQIPSAVAVRIEQMDEAGTKFPRVHLESSDKQLLGQVAARIRSIRPPEPYKGKGVRYTGERIREKAGKAGKAK